MPRILLELTENLPPTDIQGLLGKIHDCVVATIGASLEDCKSRAVIYDDYRTGNGGDEKAFVLLTVQILTGRPEAIKQKAGAELLKLLQAHFYTAAQSMAFQVTVYLEEMPRENYFK